MCSVFGRLAAAALVAAIPCVSMAATATFSNGSSLWEFGTKVDEGDNLHSSVQIDLVGDVLLWDGTGEFKFLQLTYYNAINGGNPDTWKQTITFDFNQAELDYLASKGLGDVKDFTINLSVSTTVNQACPDKEFGCEDYLLSDFIGLADSVKEGGDLSLGVDEKKTATGFLSLVAVLPPQCIEDCPPPPCLTDCGPPPPPPPPVSEVPLPASSLLLLGAVGGLLGLRRRKRG